jgi:hypothetical protein
VWSYGYFSPVLVHCASKNLATLLRAKKIVSAEMFEAKRLQGPKNRHFDQRRFNSRHFNGRLLRCSVLPDTKHPNFGKF